jgi:hypothetical protein
MYAKGSPAGIYHLLTPEQNRTLCGQAVAPIIIDRPASTSALHLATEAPADGELCEDCARKKDKE